LNYPIKLNNQLSFLLETVNAGDHKPTRQSREVFQELSQRTDALANDLANTLQTDLAQLNGLLRGQNLEPIQANRQPAR
jgi:hypothetical protein